MFIIGRGGKTYARLRFNTGPGGQIVVPTEVDYSKPFTGSDHFAWESEYEANMGFGVTSLMGSCLSRDLIGASCPDDWVEELEAMEPEERQLVLDELAARQDLWSESEVTYEYW